MIIITIFNNCPLGCDDNPSRNPCTGRECTFFHKGDIVQRPSSLVFMSESTRQLRITRIYYDSEDRWGSPHIMFEYLNGDRPSYNHTYASLLDLVMPSITENEAKWWLTNVEVKTNERNNTNANR